MRYRLAIAHSEIEEIITMASSLVSLSNELASLVENFAKQVVAVHGRPRFNSSGVHWSPGVVVTAEHTLRHDDDIEVTTGAGDRLPAEIAGRDPGTDLAVLRVKDLATPAIPKLEDSVYRPGNVVVAIGRNKDSANAALGVISSLGGASQTWRGGKLDQVIRLDLALHPVASGGAVIDASGKLIGIATPVLSRAAVFAVPNATVERVVLALLAHGKLPQGYLGAGLQPIRLPEHLTKSLGLRVSGGLMIVSVDPEAPGGKAGLLIGDVLLEFNGQVVDRPEGVRPLLAESVGKTVPVRIMRGGKLATLEITVTERQGKN
jgi:S1-C subfamily serine protease